MNNTTGSSNSSSSSASNFLYVASQVENAFKYMGFTVNLSYLIIVLLVKSLQKRTLLYLHNACLANIVQSTLQIGYIFGPLAHFPNQTLNQVLCSFSEFLWCFHFYLRMYSLLLLSIYRYLAVYKVNWYKKLNSSLRNIMMPLVAIYSIAICFPIIAKYSFQTLPSPTQFCLDGYSTVLWRVIGYFIFNYICYVLFPLIYTVLNYVLIMRRLAAVNTRLKNRGTHEASSLTNNQAVSTIQPNHMSSATGATLQNKEETNIYNPRNAQKQKRFAHQFILLMVVAFGCSIIQTFFLMRNVIPNFSVSVAYVMPFVRMINVCFFMMMPIISLTFTLGSLNSFKRAFGKIFPRPG